ncbi:MAG TPA: hypothetical protein VMU86_08480, partial [Steroidobacteraceae bacterium]|nr:hypothetical protein [Steroidobacteraceae bacterium]
MLQDLQKPQIQRVENRAAIIFHFSVIYGMNIPDYSAHFDEMQQLRAAGRKLAAMPRQSRLHLPPTPARPGEKPDFSYLQVSPAGAVARPDVSARARDIGNLAIEL